MIVRAAIPADAPAMAAVQNRIIRIGGTTAYQHERSADDVLDYIVGPASVCCHLAQADGQVIGFQSVSRYDELPPGWGDIGTFVSPDAQARGIGQALFAASAAAARAAGLSVLNATIRADNLPGLAYYSRLGFVDYDHDPEWALDDGRRVGRISRRFDL